MENSEIKHPDPSSVVKVGDGRGFVIEQRLRVIHDLEEERRLGLEIEMLAFITRRLVVTAAHCLPHLPPLSPSPTWERTYRELLGSVDGHIKQDVWAECLFVDPVADIAVLGVPDGQELYEEAEAYKALTEDVPALAIAEAKSGPAWMLALDGVQWEPTRVRVISNLYGTFLVSGPTKPGQSGSPIVDDAGDAFAVLCIGSETENSRGESAVPKETGPQPILLRDLPARFLNPEG